MKGSSVPLSLVSATDPAADAQLRRLNQRMTEFYNGPVLNQYYSLAHAANERWAPNSYHHVVSHLCQPGMNVLDLGCGSGHVAKNLAGTGIHYTGVDWSVERVKQNSREYGDAQFISSSLYSLQLPDAAFDLTLSFYVLEHLVWPHLFLEQMARLTKPGGWLVIECPHFRHNHRIPSLPYGQRIAPLDQKIRQGHLLDAATHYLQRRWLYPSRIQKDFPPDKYPFLINLEPTCLRGTYYPDNDAIYFVDRDEVMAFLAGKGLVDQTSEVCQAMGLPVPADPCLIAARRKEA